MLIYKIIHNYIRRYKLAMLLTVGATAEVIDERLGITPYKGRGRKRAHPEPFTALTMVKLLYLTAAVGLEGKNTAYMQLNINDHDCVITFNIGTKNNPTKGEEHND